MKTLILAAIRCSLIFLVPSVTYAISAQWDLDPISGDWNTAANWTPTGAPNGPADTATFALSHTSDVSISANTEVNGITFTAAATNPYTITASPGFRLSISGAGITNNSGINQNFVIAVDGAGNRGQIVFRNSATAGTSTFTNSGETDFLGNSTAGNSAFININGVIDLGGGHITHFRGETIFRGSSTAANSTFTNNGATANFSDGGVTAFLDTSTAGNGIFISNGAMTNTGTGGLTFFADASTAGNGTFINNSAGSDVFGVVGGQTIFGTNATAANGIFINNGGTVELASGGSTEFLGGSPGDTCTAGNGTFTNNAGTVSGAGGGFMFFFGNSTAGNGTFINNGGTVSGAFGGGMVFGEDSSANAATLIANGGTDGGFGGIIRFDEFSTGDTSRVEVFGNGNLDISASGATGVTVGSIEGDGNVFVGANTLTVGSNNLSTTFSGVIQDGGIADGAGGSNNLGLALTKIGTAALILSGANTYTGDTNVNRGVLQVDGSITSNTFVNHGGTLAGTGTINGNVMNNGKVSPGDSPGVLTVVQNYTQAQFATLMIQIAGANAGDFSVLNVLGNANLNGFLDPVLLNGFVPTIGDSFTFLNYASLTGEFSHIKHRVFDHGTLEWSVIYQNTNAILTVEPHTPGVPDHGSTCVLLTLGLLGLMTFRRQLLRGQP